MRLTRREAAAGLLSAAGVGAGRAAAVTEASFGRLPDGRAATLFTLTNRRGVTAKVADFGATLVSLVTPDRAGRFGDVVLGFDEVQGYAADGLSSMGATVGRFANRIDHGRFTLEGRTYQLAVNAPPHSIHGGDKGWSKALWTGRPLAHPQGPGVELTYLSPDGEEGFPGAVAVRLTYRLSEDNRLLVEAHATTTAPTVINLTNHSYFNLAADPARDVLDTELAIFADRYTPKDGTALPTGEIAPLAGTPLDFRTPKPIGRDIAAVPGGYDHNYVLDSAGDGRLRRAALARDPRSGRTLEIWTDQPGLQFYSAHWLNARGRGGAAYGASAGFCLEPQHFPDSPNKPQFPSTVLRPGQTFTWRSQYRLGVA